MMENNLPAIPKDMKPKHASFVAEYFRNGRNGTRAAIYAGYSPKSAHVTASKILRNAKVQAYMAEVYKVYHQEIEHTLNALAGIGFTDITDFGIWDTEGRFILKDPAEIHHFHMKALKEIDYEHRTETHGKGEDKYTVEINHLKLKLHDQIKALSELRRHIGGGADMPRDQMKAGEGVTVVIVQPGPFGFERQEPTEQQEIEEGVEYGSGR